MRRREGAALIVCAAMALVVVVTLSVLQMQGAHAATCDRLAAIAEDPQKMRYVRDWVASRTTDARFMEAVRESSSFARGDPRTWQYIDLDWGYLGFAPKVAWLEFNIKAADVRGVDTATIQSVTLNQERSSIIIKLDATDEFELEWLPEEMKKVRSVAKGVFVYCEY